MATGSVHRNLNLMKSERVVPEICVQTDTLIAILLYQRWSNKWGKKTTGHSEQGLSRNVKKILPKPYVGLGP